MVHGIEGASPVGFDFVEAGEGEGVRPSKMRRFPVQEFPVAQRADEGAISHSHLAADGY